jgi:hypothetical protein
MGMLDDEKLTEVKVSRYVIAVKRQMRDQVPADWIERLREIEGLSLVSEPRHNRVMVEAVPEAMKVVQAELGDYSYIEPLITHKPLKENAGYLRPDRALTSGSSGGWR